MNFLLRKYYNYLNKIDMVLLRTIAICTGSSSNTILDYNLVRFGVCIIKLCHERMLILRCILPPMWQHSGTLLFCSCHGIAGFLVDELQI